MISEKLHGEMEAAGFRFKTFKAGHLREISTCFEELVSQGVLDEKLYRNSLSNFNYDFERVMENAQTVIVLAARQGISYAVFEAEGGTIETVIPPTYNYSGIISRIEGILDNVLVKSGYSLAKAVLPMKLLAVRSGLGRYGRNNICYVPGMGSFVRLAAYITDYESGEDSWGDVKALDSCSTCTACADKCPTKAIDKGRFLIHAHNCITNFNECDIPIPEWFNPDWHNSLIGCMRCQTACPHNRKLIDEVEERVFFDRKETSMILGGIAYENLPEKTRSKLYHTGLKPYYHILPRNIRLLM